MAFIHFPSFRAALFSHSRGLRFSRRFSFDAVFPCSRGAAAGEARSAGKIIVDHFFTPLMPAAAAAMLAPRRCR